MVPRIKRSGELWRIGTRVPVEVKGSEVRLMLRWSSILLEQHVSHVSPGTIIELRRRCGGLGVEVSRWGGKAWAKIMSQKRNPPEHDFSAYNQPQETKTENVKSRTSMARQNSSSILHRWWYKLMRHNNHLIEFWQHFFAKMFNTKSNFQRLRFASQTTLIISCPYSADAL